MNMNLMTEVPLGEYAIVYIYPVCILKRLDTSKETIIKFPKVVTSLTIFTSDVVCLIPFTTEKCTQLTCTNVIII